MEKVKSTAVPVLKFSLQSAVDYLDREKTFDIKNDTVINCKFSDIKFGKFFV